jgi:3-phenylpropionate/trans-cinnamate dioxygenase ferredoxin component
MDIENENWQLVIGSADMDMQDIVRFDYDNKTYCVYKLEDGFFATDGICTHEAVHLEDGLVIDGEIECPMHQGVFDIKSGEAMSPPACDDLKTYLVKVENDQVYIKIS